MKLKKTCKQARKMAIGEFPTFIVHKPNSKYTQDASTLGRRWSAEDQNYKMASWTSPDQYFKRVNPGPLSPHTGQKQAGLHS